jgi:hypothetical protein
MGIIENIFIDKYRRKNIFKEFNRINNHRLYFHREIFNLKIKTNF